MKVLHYNLYNDSNVGMCNVMMSVENALIIAYLTKRDKIIFYGKEKLYNSTTDKKIFDLFDINFTHEIVDSNTINKEILSLPCDFYNTCFYHNEEPSKDFVNNRINVINLANYDEIDEFRTLNNSTLGFYSYLFYLGSHRNEILEFVKNTFIVKSYYNNIVQQYLNGISVNYNTFQSLHFRRGDYLYTENSKNNIITIDETLPIINEYFSKDKLVIIHSDEEDNLYFDKIKEQYPNFWFIDQDLKNTNLDIVEQGLISLLIASHSSKFIGTLFSTFTSYIQRYRKYNNLKEEFVFLYSQRDDLQLEKGKFKESSFGEHTWNRVTIPDSLKQINFWFREWQECYKEQQSDIMQSISVHPNFLTKEECNYVIAKAQELKPEFYERENRNRLTIHVNNDTVIKSIIERACTRLGYNYNHVEPSMQIFTQYEGGQTFSHTDSLYEDYQGKRISSILFYLNQDFDGSYIDFPYIGTRIKPQTGMMFAYPLVNEYNEQDKLWTHSATLITRGTKYMMYFSLKQKPF